jgi:CheY-like chemotaxis protein/two-component sensor histidine kinase
MARLTDDLLDVARITHGRIELRNERVDLAVIVGRALETVRPQFEEHHQELRVSTCTEKFVLSADAARLEQVLVNLLGNAAKHSGAGSRICLDVQCSEGEAILRVCDNGAGIAPEMLAHIFEPFIRTANSGEDEQGGLGLGLTLVKKLVELHGGSVTAFSEGPGHGCEFVVLLPRASGEWSVVRGEERGQPPLTTRCRVLLVDDNADAVVTLGEILGMVGHDVCVAHSGPEAIEKAREHQPDVVILDIGMPGMDGYEVARRLREAGALADALLVAMTGFGQERDRERSLVEGFHHHLVKPVQVDSILALLNGKSARAGPALTGTEG